MEHCSNGSRLSTLSPIPVQMDTHTMTPTDTHTRYFQVISCTPRIRKKRKRIASGRIGPCSTNSGTTIGTGSCVTTPHMRSVNLWCTQVFQCVCVCPVCLSVCLPVCLCKSVYLHICISVCLADAWLAVCPVCHSVSLSVSVSRSLSVSLSVCLPVTTLTNTQKMQQIIDPERNLTV